MWRGHARTMLWAAVMTGAIGIVGCGGSAPASSSGGAASGGPVNVTLSEWSVKPSATSAKAGSVSFAVTNKGTTPHEFVVVKTDLAGDKLPQGAGIVDEKQVTVIGRTASIDAGKSETKAVDLQAGKYVLICNLPAHYGQGMQIAFTVQ